MCPRCGTECLFSRAEALENEEEQMKELSKRLAAIPRGSEEIRLKEAKAIISRLRAMNMRWNIESLNQFLTQRQKELFF